MGNNWVKSGLDAYLSLTGEHRAEKKAEADLEAQKHSQSVTNQNLELAKNQDQRSAISSGLTNQVTQQQIDDAEKWDKLLFQRAYEKEYANPQTPTAATINDPAQVEASRYTYGNALKTVEFVKTLPPNMKNFSVPAGQLEGAEIPSFVRTTAMNMFTPAAKKRAGQQSVDPVTGKVGVITGNMGNINIERDEKGEAYISADMEVKNEDGTIRYAPFTNGTDDPNQPVKRMPLSALAYEANATLQGIEDALQSGIDPSVAIAARKLDGSKDWPRELKRKMYLDMLEEDKNLRTMDSDVAITKKVGKTLESLMPTIDALPWKTDPQSAAMQLYTTLSQSGMTNTEAEKALKVVTSAKMPPGKSFKTVEIGAGGDMVQMVTIDDSGNTTPLGKAYPKFARKQAGTDNGDLQAKRDVATRLREAQRGYQAAKKSGDPDAVAEAVEYIELLNADARAYGVQPLPLPKRAYTTAEEDSLKEMATESLNKKRSKFSRWTGTTPAAADVAAEVSRLKQTFKPGAVSSSEASMEMKSSHGPGAVLSRPSSNNPTTSNSVGSFDLPQSQTKARQQSAPANTSSGFPSASQHSGRTIKDTTTGKRYRSNGASWQEVR